MLGGELEPSGRSGPALAEVAAEMREIFDQAGLGPFPAGVAGPPATAALRPSRGRGLAITLLTAAVTGLLGFGAGALVFRAPGSPAPVSAKAAAQSQPRQSQPQPPSPVTPPIALAEASAAPAVEQGPPAKASSAVKAPSHRKGLSRAARSRAEFRLKLARLGGPSPAQATPPIRLGAPKPVAQPASCERDEGSEDCRRAVIQADRHLRAVFQGAFERGVSRKVLVDYRERWADLRERNSNDPVRLIESYGGLAYDLGRETPADHDGAPPPKGLADLLPPWR
jgi:hypothetical protein